MRVWLLAARLLALVCVGCSAAPTEPPPQPAPNETRERAYRANNIGVALLEQLKFAEAEAAFTDALRTEPSLGVAHFNLSLARLYAQDFDNAQKAAEEAATRLPQAPQPPYVLGLIARAQGRTDVARTQFDRVRQMDPRDVGVNINVAQIALEEQRYADAVAALKPVVAEESSNVTAAYVLGLALTRSGETEEGQRLLTRAQELRNTGYAVTLGPGYSEQGRYAEGIASTGVEPDLIEPVSSRISFTVTPLGPRGWQGGARGLNPSLALLDVDADGDLDVLVIEQASARLVRNDGSAWVDATTGSGLDRELGGAAVVGVVAADYDNDGDVDLLILRPGRSSLFHNDGKGHFTDVTSRSGLPPFPAVPGAAAFVDVDHDGDLDIALAGLTAVGAERSNTADPRARVAATAPAPVQLLRNNRDGTFTEITRAAQLERAGHVVAIVPTDYDNRRDMDLLLVDRQSAPALFANQRDGRFRDVAANVGLDAVVASGQEIAAVSSGDINKDEAPDFVFAASRGLIAAMSDGRGRFSRQPITEGEAYRAVQLADYDNDGLLDAIAWAADGPRLWRNEGGRWRDVSELAFAVRPGTEASTLRSAHAWSVADVDRDGWTDLVTAGADGLWLWRNGGDPSRRSLRVELTGLVSNKPAVGSKVQVRAGSLSSRAETSATSPAVSPADLVFGVGQRPGSDVVRVLWPSGILQAEVAEQMAGSATVLPTPYRVAELDRKPSSCPFLYVWNGERFEFVTDFLGAGEMGSWLAPGTRNRPDPVEYVRIRGDQLRARDGRFELRVTNELEETLFLDAVRLEAIAHPEGTSVFPNEGMTDPPKPHRLHLVRNLRPPSRVTDEHGHDVTDRVRTLDWSAPDDFIVHPIRGYAAPHALTIDVGPEPRPLVVLTGWTDYAFSSDNVAAHQAGLTSQPPTLDVRTPEGSWRPLAVPVGIPVGRPQSIAISLAGGVLRPGEHELRLSTSMRVYWDQILVGTAADEPMSAAVALPPVTADLRIRGFSAEIRAHARRPPLYDYSRVSLTSPWKAMAGAFTAEGNVGTLVSDSDDRFVIARSGDEIALTFDARALPPLPPGWTRTFLLRADGFSKEMDINSASPDAVEPLPFHRMSGYPYPADERYPETDAHDAYRRRFNTRHVVKPWLPLFGNVPAAHALP